MKHRMKSLWRLGCGITVKDLGAKLILFWFYHQHDICWVMDGWPWTFDNHLLLLNELKPRKEPTKIPLFFTPFWVQVYDLSTCFFHQSCWEIFSRFCWVFYQIQ